MKSNFVGERILGKELSRFWRAVTAVLWYGLWFTIGATQIYDFGWEATGWAWLALIVLFAIPTRRWPPWRRYESYTRTRS